MCVTTNKVVQATLVCSQLLWPCTFIVNVCKFINHIRWITAQGQPTLTGEKLLTTSVFSYKRVFFQRSSIKTWTNNSLLVHRELQRRVWRSSVSQHCQVAWRPWLVWPCMARRVCPTPTRHTSCTNTVCPHNCPRPCTVSRITYNKFIIKLKVL